MIQWRPKGNLDPTAFDREIDYSVVIEHSKACWSYLDHMVEIEPAIHKQAPAEVKPGQPVHLRVTVKGGQVIGKIGYQTFEFALIDTAVTRKGFINPDQFRGRDPWKLHTVDPFDYVNEPLRSKLLALNPRKEMPRGGRMDYDIDGRLIGNWYRKDTGGYGGLNRRLDDWVGHLAIAPYYIDPSQIIAYLGEFEGKAQQFRVKVNAPDPAKVSKADGPITYELMRPSVSDGSGRPMHDRDPSVHGVLVVQLIDDRVLRVEVFPGKTTDQIKTFTNASMVYER